MVAEAERMRDTYGITTFKVKVGRRPVVARHRRRPRAAGALGDAVELYVDGNRGWTAASRCAP